MAHFRSIADIRRNYGALNLSEESLPNNPVLQFTAWFAEVLKNEKDDPTAMVLSTVDENSCPDSRVVLLKGLNKGSFIFYTNYQSAKARQMQHKAYVALNFYWPGMARQVRVRGQVKQLGKKQSDAYFSSRPINSQFSAIISPQSHEIPDRKTLEKAFNDLIQQYGEKPVVRPNYWGGYKVIPAEMEFWQGRDDRLHDRIHYYLQDGRWQHHRLAP